MINQKIKILHTVFLYCTGLRSSNITRNSALNEIHLTLKKKISYYILSDRYTDNSSFFRGDTDQEETESSDGEKEAYVEF